MIKSIRLQLTFWYIGSISLLILIFGLIAYFSLQIILVRNIDSDLYNGGRILEQSLSEFRLKWESDQGRLVGVDANGETFSLDEETKAIFFVNVAYAQLLAFPEEGGTSVQEIAKTATLQERSLPLSPKAAQALKNGSYLAETVPDIFPFPVRVMTLGVHDQDRRMYILQIGLSLQGVHATLRELLFVFSILSPGLLVIISVLGYVFMKRAFLPVKNMVAVTKRITAENLSHRLDPIHSRDEIGELADTLNDMIARLERSFNQINQFSGNVSHELKTPLSKLKCNAEVALRKERTPEEYQHVLKNVIEDAAQLQKIIEDLLFLARMDSQSTPLVFSPVALHEVFLEVFEDIHRLAQQKKLAITFQEIQPVTIQGDIGLLKRFLLNLIVNAIQYTPSGGKITFSLQKAADSVVLTITDTGIGIPTEALPYIFDRFYRVDPSRSHETGGSGLGLAIVQKIVEMHQGKISVQSTVGQGTTFWVSFPC